MSELINIILIASLVILCAFFFYKRQTFAIGLYVFTTLVIYVIPAVIESTTIYHHPLYNGVEIQNRALFYILLYNVVLVVSYFTLLFVSSSPSLKIFDLSFCKSNNKSHIAIILIFLFFCFILASIILYKNNLFGVAVYDFNFPEQTMPKLIQLLKAIATYNAALILLLGYFNREKIYSGFYYYVIYCALIIVAFYFAFTSGSRYQVIFLSLIMLYQHFVFFKKYWAVSFLAGVFLLLVFKVSGSYRNARIRNPDHTYVDSLLQTFDLVTSNMSEIFLSVVDVLVTRLNYLDVVSRVIDFSFIKNELTFIYINNFIGLVPRVFWEGKPIIGVDWINIGHQLLITGTHNSTTAVGLGIIGESYYELKMFGLFVAIFHAGLIYFIDVKINVKNVIGYVLYPLLSIFIVSKDSFVAVIPGVIYVIFPLLFVLWLLNGYCNNANYRG